MYNLLFVKCLDGYTCDVRSVVCLVVIRISHMSQLVMELVLPDLWAIGLLYSLYMDRAKPLAYSSTLILHSMYQSLQLQYYYKSMSAVSVGGLFLQEKKVNSRFQQIDR